MLVYVSKEFHATAAGAALRGVVCENCGGEYFYEVSHVAVGSGSSPYHLNNEGARNRANERAEANLRKALRDAVDLRRPPGRGRIVGRWHGVGRDTGKGASGAGRTAS